MKKLVCLSFLFLFLVSCKKEKQTSIVGIWKEVSIYYQDDQGNYKWNDVLHGFTSFLTFTDTGTYSAWQCTPAGRGYYQYDHASKQVRMEDISSGIISIRSVSLLDNDHLILDHGMTSMGEFKVKYTRNRY